MFKEASKYALNSNLFCSSRQVIHYIPLFESLSLPPFNVHGDAITTADPTKFMSCSKLNSWDFQGAEN